MSRSLSLSVSQAISTGKNREVFTHWRIGKPKVRWAHRSKADSWLDCRYRHTTFWAAFSTGALSFPDRGFPSRTSSQTDVILITDQLSPTCDPRHNSVAGKWEYAESSGSSHKQTGRCRRTGGVYPRTNDPASRLGLERGNAARNDCLAIWGHARYVKATRRIILADGVAPSSGYTRSFYPLGFPSEFSAFLARAPVRWAIRDNDMPAFEAGHVCVAGRHHFEIVPLHAIGAAHLLHTPTMYHRERLGNHP